MKSLAVWDDIEIYTDTIGLVVTLQLAQIEVDDFYTCDDMFHQTSVTKHIVGWERELTIFCLKGKYNLDFLVLLFKLFFVFFVFLFCFVLYLFCLFFFFWFVVLNFSLVKTEKEQIEPWLSLGLANTPVVCK